MSQRKPSAVQWTKHRLLAAWRGAEEGPILNHKAVNVGDVLGKIVQELGMKDKLLLDDVLAAWNEAAGEFIAKHTRPDAVNRGVLTVRLLQPAIHYALQAEKQRLIERLQQALGHKKIRDVRFRHG
jgi:predicted nucleic acid-binding Zn ribbon protein